MEDDVANVSARYEAGSLIVTEHDHMLRPPLERQDLISYLDFLAEQGWVATTGTFEGFTVEIELQRTFIDQHVSYCKQEHQFGAHVTIQRGILKELKQPMLKYGWKEITCSTLLGLTVASGGTSVIILWLKVLPKLPSPL